MNRPSLTGAHSAAGQTSSGTGKMYPPMLTADVPKPAAFFPLTEGYGDTVTSFPDMQYNGTLQGYMPCVSPFLTLPAKLAQISPCDQDRDGTQQEHFANQCMQQQEDCASR